MHIVAFLGEWEMASDLCQEPAGLLATPAGQAAWLVSFPGGRICGVLRSLPRAKGMLRSQLAEQSSCDPWREASPGTHTDAGGALECPSLAADPLGVPGGREEIPVIFEQRVLEALRSTNPLCLSSAGAPLGAEIDTSRRLDFWTPPWCLPASRCALDSPSESLSQRLLCRSPGPTASLLRRCISLNSGPPLTLEFFPQNWCPVGGE